MVFLICKVNELCDIFCWFFHFVCFEVLKRFSFVHHIQQVIDTHTRINYRISYRSTYRESKSILIIKYFRLNNSWRVDQVSQRIIHNLKPPKASRNTRHGANLCPRSFRMLDVLLLLPHRIDDCRLPHIWDPTYHHPIPDRPELRVECCLDKAQQVFNLVVFGS